MGQAPKGNTTMAWERRKRGGLYYTRSRKIAGRVVREYVGGGVIGVTAATLDTERRVETEQKARTWIEQRSRLQSAQEASDGFFTAVELLAHSTFLNAGFYLHHRGQWRKRRGRDAGKAH
jgi:hypothetical protein